MPIFASEPATTVRQHSRWQLPLPAYGAIFLTVALAAYGWRFFNSRPLKIDVPTQAIAKVCIHHPDFPYQQAWQEILGPAKSEVRENLQVAGQPSGQQTVVAISLSHLPSETMAPLVNVVAAAYSQACRAQWKLYLEHSYSTEQEKVRQAEREASEARTCFELLRDRRLRAIANLKPGASSQPASIENPLWTEICHRLADLEDREKNLLLQRTKLHPSVQEIEQQILDVRREMASIPPKITRETPAPSPPSSQPSDALASAEVDAAQSAVVRLNLELRQAQAAEQAALKARGEELRIDLLAAAPPSPPPVPRHATTVILGKSLVIAATSTVGLGMVSVGAGLEPALSSLVELQAFLPAPIIGVIPATHPGRRSASTALRRRLARYGWVTAGLGVLVAVAWLFFCG